MKVLIGTKNPGKIEGAKKALEKFFDNVEVVGISSPSNVSEQPVGKEILIGANNRVDNLIKYANENNLKADLFMAIESGITKGLGVWTISNLAVIKDGKGQIGVGASSSFPVPEKYVKNIIEKDLAIVMDELFNKTDLRSTTGGVGILTKDAMTRIDLNTQATIMALTQFVNDKIWSSTNDELELSLLN